MSAANVSRLGPEREAGAGFESELHISLGPVIAALAFVGVLFVLWGTVWPDASDQIHVYLLAMLFYVLSFAAWLLDRWRPLAGRWFTVLALVGIVVLSSNWLHVPGILTLLVLPTALAAASISAHAAAAVALGETALLVALSMYVAVGTDLATTGLSLAAIWGIVGVMYAVYRPVHQTAR